MKYKNFVFDLYGTLADIYTDEDSEESYRKLAAFCTSRGAEYTAEEMQAAFHALVQRQIAERTGSVYEPTGETIRFPEMDVMPIYEELFRAKGIALTRQEAVELARWQRRESTCRLSVYPGAAELLCRLRAEGHGVYLLSNAQREYTVYDLKLLKLEPLFDGILLSSDYGCRKPDPIFFGELTRQFGVLPENSVMIGNDRSSDIYGAKLFGMDSVLLVTGKELAAPMEGVESTYTVESGTYRELEALIQGWPA